MNLDSLEILEQIEKFLSGTQPVAFGMASTQQERYDWLQKTLIKWRYQTRSRCERGLLMRSARSDGFKRQYTDADVRLLARIDNLHGDTQWRGQQVYLMRKARHYPLKHLTHTKTNPTKVAIGERRKPHPEGQPGYTRIDTVHQGDLDKQKGVHHINAVDEVTQFEVLATVVAISERFLLPALAQLLTQFPFTLKGFHSDKVTSHNPQARG